MNGGRKLAPVTLLACMLIGSAATAQEASFTERARKLSDLRGEIENLESRIQTERQIGINEVESLISQAEELEMLIQKEQIRLQTVNRMIDEKKQQDSQAHEAVEGLKAPVIAAIARIRTKVAAGLPFRLSERMDELNQLERAVSTGQVDALTAVSRLWQFVEDEMKLSGETGQYKQVVVIDGEKVLTDVIRVGMMVMYYRTDEREYGMTVKKDDSFAFEQVADQAATEGIDALFDSLGRQVRQGRFNLPLRLMVPGGTAE